MSTGGAHPASEATRAMPGFANSETKLAPKEPKKHSLESIESTYILVKNFCTESEDCS